MYWCDERSGAIVCGERRGEGKRGEDLSTVCHCVERGEERQCAFVSCMMVYHVTVYCVSNTCAVD